MGLATWYNRFDDREFRDGDGRRTTLDGLCRSSPSWAANRIRELECMVAELLELSNRCRVIMPLEYHVLEERTTMNNRMKELHIVFDGPPSHEDRPEEAGRVD